MLEYVKRLWLLVHISFPDLRTYLKMKQASSISPLIDGSFIGLTFVAGIGRFS